MRVQRIVFNTEGLSDAEIIRSKLVLTGIRLAAEIGSGLFGSGVSLPRSQREKMYSLMVEVQERMGTASRVLLYEFFLWNKARIHSVTLGGETKLAGEVKRIWWDSKFTFAEKLDEAQPQAAVGSSTFG